jgi:hypothetical protein
VSTAESTLFIASYNTRAATELAVRSSRRFAGCPFDLVVGDSASRDGSREMLGKLERQGLLRLVSVSNPRRHAEWLDWFLGECATPVGVVIDSDIEFLEDNWLVDLVGFLVEHDAALVGSESTAESAAFTTPKGDVVHLMPRTAAPWVMAFDTAKLRALGGSFVEVREGEDSAGRPYVYDVAGYVQKLAREGGFPVLVMPASYRSRYRHFIGLSWRREPGLRGAARRYVKLLHMYQRVMLRRFVDDRCELPRFPRRSVG